MASEPKKGEEKPPESNEELEISEVAPREKRDLIVVAVASVVLSIVLYFLFFAPSISWLQNAKQVGKIQTNGTVRRRHGGNLAWGNIKGSAPVYLHDIVYVPKGTEASVTLGQKTVPLPDDTMIQFDEDFTTGGNFEIKLLEIPKVPALPLPLKITKLGNLLPDVHPLELRLSELKARTLEKVFAQLNLIRIPPLERYEAPAVLTIEDYEIRLILPENERYNLKANRWMKMAWSKLPFPDVTYHVEIGKEADFRRVLAHETKKTQFSAQFDDEATYYWRVRGERAGKQVTSPASKFVMTIRGGKSQRQPALAIPNDSPPVGYPVEIATDPEFEKVVRTVLHNEVSCPDSGLPPGVYYCRVRQQGATATRGKVLKTYRFKIYAKKK